MGKLTCHKYKKIKIITEESYSYNHIISLHCKHRSIILNDKTFKIRRSVQISIRHIYVCIKLHTANCHKICHQCFLRTDNIHSHQLRNQNAYYIQQIRTNTRKSTINFSGPKFWNTLLPIFDNLIPYTSLKRNSKRCY